MAIWKDDDDTDARASDALWPAVTAYEVGQTLTINGAPHTVVSTGTSGPSGTDDDIEQDDDQCPDCKRVNCSCVDRDTDDTDARAADSATLADLWIDEQASSDRDEEPLWL